MNVGSRDLWSYCWTPTRPGEHRLVVRTFDGLGKPQVDKETESGPKGATGLHQITARIA